MLKQLAAGIFAGAWLAMAGAAALAGEADVIAAQAVKTGERTYRISATIRHADTGWEHYCDRFDVLTVDGKVVGERILYHPHVNEQPFTRSLGGVKVEEGVGEVIVRAHDKVHGLGGRTVRIKLP